MDELVKELMDRAGLSEEQAKAAAEVVVEWVKDADKRKKIIAATVASTVRPPWSPSTSSVSPNRQRRLRAGNESRLLKPPRRVDGAGRTRWGEPGVDVDRTSAPS